MENNKVAISMEQQFGEVIDIILQHKGRASRAVNRDCREMSNNYATN